MNDLALRGFPSHRRRSNLGRLVTATLLGVALMAPARIAAGDDARRPWARGVSPEEQERATELFERGNRLLDEGLFAPALEVYQRALEHWSHPAIHFNTAVALINLERPLEAYREIERALRYGAAALDVEVYQQATVYRRLLERQIGRLTVECDQAGTRISLDGKDLLDCPGHRTRLLLAGEHQLVADGDDYLTLTTRLVLDGGKRRSLRVGLIPLDQATVTRRRWAAWKPWTVVGAGVLLGLVGAGFEARAASWLEGYDNAVASLCADRPCADVDPVVTDAYHRGRLENRVAIGLFVAGGAALATGVALLVVNRPIEKRIGYGDLTVTPAVTGGGAGVTGKVSF